MTSARAANENVPKIEGNLIGARPWPGRPLRPEAKAEFAKPRLIMYNNIAG